MKILKFISLKCVKSSSGAGNDDLFFQLTVDSASRPQAVPSDPDTTHSWDIDPDLTMEFQPSSKLQDDEKVPGSKLTIVYDSEVLVELMDYDSGSGNDSLGSITFTSSDSSGEQHFKNQDEGDDYILKYKIISV